MLKKITYKGKDGKDLEGSTTYRYKTQEITFYIYGPQSLSTATIVTFGFKWSWLEIKGTWQ